MINHGAFVSEQQNFSELALPENVVANLTELGYTTLTPIQQKALPLVLQKHDVIGQAKTGSGKTAAFGIGLLELLDKSKYQVQSLVLCPTRELADQVSKELRKLARCYANIKVLTLSGGVPIGPQIGSLAHGAHIVVGTPGRVLKLLGKEVLKLDAIQTFVLDEADRMLDMGFYDDMVEIASRMPSSRQTVLFSATFPKDIETLSERFMRAPKKVVVESVHSTSVIEQRSYEVGDLSREDLLVNVLTSEKLHSAVLFCNTKIMTEKIASLLKQYGFSAKALHGDLDQKKRDQMLVQFSNGSCSYLVATDVAARGLDIKSLEAVINVELSRDPEVHIHRIGRTGRAGEKGFVANIVAPEEQERAIAIEKLQGYDFKWSEIKKVDVYSNEKVKPHMQTLALDSGKRDKLRPGDILGALTKDAGLPFESIGKIDIFPNFSYVAINKSHVDAALNHIQNGKVKGRNVKARKLS